MPQAVGSFSWNAVIAELQKYAPPTLLELLQGIVDLKRKIGKAKSTRQVSHCVKKVLL